MRNLTFLKLFLTTMFVMTTALFTSCVDDNDDTEAPYLEVSPTTLVFDTDGAPVEGSQSSFEISTNRHWTATVMNDVSWVTLSKMEGDGSATVQVSIPEGITDEAKVLIQMSNKVGVLMSQTVTIRSGNVLPETLIYTETFGTTAPSSSPYPFIDTFTDWVKSGEGSSTVEYTGTAASIRQSGKLSAGYIGASGGDKLFFGANANFVVNKVTLKESQTNLKLTFGGSYYNGTTQDGVFKPEKFHFYLSADGKSWSNEVTYTIQKADDYWIFATANFTLKNPTTTLYIKFTADDASVFSIDDPTLKTGQGGQEIDLGKGGGETPELGENVTIPELIARMTADKVILDNNADHYLVGVVQNDVAGGNYSFNNLILATQNATTAGNGITLYGSQVEPSTLNLNKGDIVKVTLKKGLAQIQNYNGMYEVTGDKDAAWATIEKTGTATINPIKITADKLAEYQGMPVTIDNASTATGGTWANSTGISPHTFAVNGTDFTVFCKKDATVFVNVPFKAATGTISGLAAVNNNAGQLVPRNLDDVTAFKSTDPTIVATNPKSIDFPTTGGTEEIEVTVTNQGNSQLKISGLSGILSATINGTKVIVVAQENTKNTADSQTLKISIDGGNEVEVPVKVAAKPTGNETVITLDVTTEANYPQNFPIGNTNKLSGSAPYTFMGYEYIVNAPTAYYQIANSGKVYIFLGKKGAYVELPAIANKKLTKITVNAHAGAAKGTKVGIADTNNNIIEGGTPITRDDANFQFVFNQLSGTSVNTKYRILVDSDANAQFGGWTLTYE